MQLREYQQQVATGVFSAWDSGYMNVLTQLATGGGKTPIIAHVIQQKDTPTWAIAHRRELVSQMAKTLARCGVRHKILAPKDVIRGCVGEQQIELGRSYYSPNSHVMVASVDTLAARAAQLTGQAAQVGLWICDEAHHLLLDNKWGRVAEMCKNARGLGVSATPERADGRGLGRWADGLFDTMVTGPSMRWLIDQGYLTDYVIYSPPQALNMTGFKPGKTGDYKRHDLAEASHQSATLVGDIVGEYLKHARGKRGITFVTDIDTAHNVAQRFNDAGIPAAAISSKNTPTERAQALKAFRLGHLKQLVNVDLFGEGFDLPAVEVVSMARPTQSFVLYCQQFGRALRLMEGKRVAIIIDHVGNVFGDNGHGLPDAVTDWSLDGRVKRQRQDAEIMVVCRECSAAYLKSLTYCECCGEPNHLKRPPSPTDARRPLQEIPGELIAYGQEELAAIRAKLALTDMGQAEYQSYLASKRMPGIGQMRMAKLHAQNQQAQQALRQTIDHWGQLARRTGLLDAHSYQVFKQRYGIDVLSAQTLKSDQATKLMERIANDFTNMGRALGHTERRAG